MAFENLILEDKSHVRVITINRPKVLNALNKKVLLELEKALSEVNQNKAIRCAIITGSGEKSFVAGADISEMHNLDPIEAEAFSGLGQRLMDSVAHLRVPVIAAVNGFALGGGLELALACDFIIASENASFGLVETKLGLIPGFGGTARLAHRVGTALAKEMIFAASQLSAAVALQVGLVNRVVGEGQVLEAAKNLADRISERGPLAVSLAKRFLKDADSLPISAINNLERVGFGLVFATRDHKEGIKAFLEKRIATFEGA